MSKELIISLYVLGGLLALWLLIVIILLISIIVLKRNIRREKSAINIILAQKYDIAIVLAKFYIENQVILPQEVQEELNFLTYCPLLSGCLQQCFQHFLIIIPPFSRKSTFFSLKSGSTDFGSFSPNQTFMHLTRLFRFLHFINFRLTHFLCKFL